MKLGENQLKWIKELEEHPERQISGYLGEIGEEVCELCCLGQGVVVLENIDVNNFEGSVVSGASFIDLSAKHQKLLGLKDGKGSVNKDLLPNGHCFKDEIWDSLVSINDDDNGYPFKDNEQTWVLIAKTMREYPKWAFKESR